MTPDSTPLFEESAEVESDLTRAVAMASETAKVVARGRPALACDLFPRLKAGGL